MPTPPGCFWNPGNGGQHLWGSREVQVFTLTVLLTHPAQMSVFANNVAAQGGEERPRQ